MLERRVRNFIEFVPRQREREARTFGDAGEIRIDAGDAFVADIQHPDGLVIRAALEAEHCGRRQRHEGKCNQDQDRDHAHE